MTEFGLVMQGGSEWMYLAEVKICPHTANLCI